MKWWWLFILIVVSGLAIEWLNPSTPRAMALGNPCAQDPNNLTTNGSMIGPGHQVLPYGILADGWTPFVLSAAIPHFEWVNNEQSPGDPGGSQHIWADLDQFDAGIYQTVSNLTPGASYHMWLGFARTAYDPADGNPRNEVTNLIGRQVGVDVNGGVNPSAPGLMWGSVFTPGGQALGITQLHITFTMPTTRATIFMRAINQNTIGRSKVWFDSVCMEHVNAPPVTLSHVYLPLITMQSAPTPVCTVSNVATITVGAHPKAIAADPASNRAFVGLFDSSSVAVIDTMTNTKIATWTTTDSNGHSNGIGFTSGRLFVSMRDTARVAILDATNGSFIGFRSVGALPYGVGAANGKVWVANYSSRTVSVIDAATTNLILSPTIGDSPSLVAAANDRAYVSYWGGGIAVIGNDGSNLGNFTTAGGGSYGVAINAAANRLYATNRATNAVSILDATTGVVKKSIIESFEPYAIAVNPTTNHAFIVSAVGNFVRVRDATTLAFVTDIPVGTQTDLSGDGGDGIVVSGNQIYVSNYAAGTVSVLSETCQ